MVRAKRQRSRWKRKLRQTAVRMERGGIWRTFRPAAVSVCICGLVFLCLSQTAGAGSEETSPSSEPSVRGTAICSTESAPPEEITDPLSGAGASVSGQERGLSCLEETLFSACAKLLFPASRFPEQDETDAAPDAFLAGMIRAGVPWYSMIKRPGEDKPRESDPAYRRCLENQKTEEEYREFVDKLSGSSVLGGNSGFLSENGGENQEAENQTASGTPVFAGLGTTAGEFLLKRSELPIAGKTYLLEQLADYDYVIKNFYTVHPTAAAGRDMINAETFLSKDFALEQDSSRPQILIYHSHSQEEFADYHRGNSEATIVGVGEYLTELLRKKGYQVIHDTSVYDLREGTLDRSKAYTYALEGIESILEENPSIQVVLDLHRDGVAEGTHLVREINGKPTATVMFFNGTSQTPDGPISYLENPNREDNLAFSFQLKLCAEAFYPGYTRNIYLKGLRYNLHVRPRSALIEVGAQTNTYEEARNAMEPLAELLDTVLGKRQMGQQ